MTPPNRPSAGAFTCFDLVVQMAGTPERPKEVCAVCEGTGARKAVTCWGCGGAGLVDSPLRPPRAP